MPRSTPPLRRYRAAGAWLGLRIGGGVPSRGGAFGVLYTALVSECVASPFLCMEQRAEAGIRAYPCLPAARLLSR
eukprot:s1441_g6.t2